MSAGFNWGGPNTSNFRFDLGPHPVTSDIIYNDPSNFGYAFQNVMMGLGANNPSSNWYRFLQNYMPQMKSQWGVYQANNPEARVQDYFNQAVPKLGEQYGLLSAEDRGVNPRIAGVPRFLG